MLTKHIMHVGSILMILLPLISFAQADEVRIIKTSPRSFNVYGHWLPEKGQLPEEGQSPEVVLKRFGTQVYADGWRIHRALPAVESGPRNLETKSPELELSDEICALRNQLFDKGFTAAEVVEACINRLKESGLVQGDPEPAGGAMYLVRFHDADTPPTLLTLGARPPDMEAEKAERELEEACSFFRRVGDSLERGDLVIVSSHVVQQLIIIPAADKCSQQVVDALADVENPQIKLKNWRSTLINFYVAEQMRNPMPLTRREGR